MFQLLLPRSDVATLSCDVETLKCEIFNVEAFSDVATLSCDVLTL